MNKLYHDEIKVTNWWLSSWGHSVEIHTEMWKIYKTSLFKQKTFEFFVTQNFWKKIDKIIQIKISTRPKDSFYINCFKEADDISDWLKSKMTKIYSNSHK